MSKITYKQHNKIYCRQGRPRRAVRYDFIKTAVIFDTNYKSGDLPIAVIVQFHDYNRPQVFKEPKKITYL